MDLLHVVNKNISQFKTSKIVVSVSMGVDSLTLLHILRRLDCQIIAVHFNHHKRDVANLEQEAFLNYCLDNNISHSCHDIIVERGNFQQQARLQRNQILCKIARQNDAVVMTGHHLDDAIETYIFNMIKGSSNWRNIGIKQSTNFDGILFFRPMLAISKTQIIDYAATYNLPFWEDQSNTLNDYDRNKLRNIVLPTFAQINPKYRETIAKQIVQAVKVQNLIDFEVTNFLVNNAKETKSGININRNQFNAQNEIIKLQIVVKIAEKFNMTFKTQLLNSCIKAAELEGNRAITCKNTYAWQCEYDTIKFLKISANKNLEFNENLEVNKDILLPSGNVLWYNGNNRQNASNTNEIFYLLNDEISHLGVRTIKRGDRINFKNGTKKVSRILIDKKIPKEIRQTLVVIYHKISQEILWVPGVWKINRNESDYYLEYKIKEKA